MPTTVPPASNADGMTRYWWVAAIPDPAAPIAATVTAGTDISCYITSDGWKPGADQAPVVDKRICATQDFEGAGRSKRSLDLTYVENPAVPASNVAFTTMIPGTSAFIVERRGVSVDTAATAAQLVNVYPVQAGIRMQQPPEENGKLKVNQKMFVTGPFQQSVALV